MDWSWVTCAPYTAFINRGIWEVDASMALRNHTLFSQPPQCSPALSAIQSSPLATRLLSSYEVTTSPFSSSPTFSSSPSPDLFEEFTYNEDMDADFCRIDLDATSILESKNIQTNGTNPLQNRVVHGLPSTLPWDQKTWVVFCGKVPGIYDHAYASPLCTG